jgi:gamma-glutamyl hercynylcysteine S-oxide synthase
MKKIHIVDIFWEAIRDVVCVGLMFATTHSPLEAQSPIPAGAGRRNVASPTIQGPQFEQIPGPSYDIKPGAKPSAGQRDVLKTWHEAINLLRVDGTDRFGLDVAIYDRPELKWTQSSYVQPQMMIHDRYFYDPVAHKYTVDRYLADVERRYGGIDAVLIWPCYPNIGIDNRNQYDLFADQPGGIAGIRQMIADFHRAGVRVLYPIYAWDQGTRRPGTHLWDGIAKVLAEVGADGINGDTLPGVPWPYRTASDKTGHPLALQPEGALGSLEMIGSNSMTWGYWSALEGAFVPAISRYKWYEPHHMVNVCERWIKDHTDALQAAFFNGVGFESWENIWGIWNGVTPRDGEALRRVATIERRFTDFLVSPGWEPHTPTEQYGVFASRWPNHGATLWTLVNRAPGDSSGIQLIVPAAPGARFFDLWNGCELHPQAQDGKIALSFPIEGRGFGAILETAQPPADLPAFLQKMAGYAEKPLSSYSSEWRPLPQQIVDIPATAPATRTPEGMVMLPATAAYTFKVTGVEIEGFPPDTNGDGSGTQYPWEKVAKRIHPEHAMEMKGFWIDRYPVTNAQYKAFLDATHYHPVDDHNFLRDWSNGSFPGGSEKRPVTWVSYEDARAYAKWAGKRLPHEWEWQYAAQGTDGRRYPWGSEWNDDLAPHADDGTDLPPPSNVDAHPNGVSPFGVMDLVGNVWQMTDEYIDDHTRAGILKGGSHYRPQWSKWYFPQAKAVDEHGKLLLMAPSIDRSGTVGFRCVKDAN